MKKKKKVDVKKHQEKKKLNMLNEVITYTGEGIILQDQCNQELKK